MAEIQNLICGIIGRKGSGKSTLLQEVLEMRPRLFILDTVGEHRWVPNRFYDIDEADQFLAWGDTQPTFAGAFVPEDDLESGVSDICSVVYGQGCMTFAVEEVPMFCQPQWLPPELDRIVRLGRHRRIDLIYTAQRASEVARRLTAATDRFAFFSCTEPRDLEAITDRCGPHIADQVAGLPIHGSLIYDVLERRVIASRAA